MKLQLALVVTLGVALAACGGQPAAQSDGTALPQTTAPAAAQADEDEVMTSGFEDGALDEWDGARDDRSDEAGEAGDEAGGGDEGETPEGPDEAETADDGPNS